MKLSEVCLNIVDCPHSTAPDEGSGYALIRTPNIGKGRFNLEGVHRISEVAYKKRCARITPTVNDLILAREAPAGNVAIIKENMEPLALGQRTVLIRPNPEKVNPDYLVYYLLAPKQQNELLGRATGATVAHVNIPIINNLPISLPPIENQQKIAGILSAYDDLIENNRKQIKLLEEAAQKLYKEWFVKLNFPGHENTKIVDGVPEGWKKVSAEDYFEITIGKTPPRNETKWFSKTNGVKWISIADMGNSDAFILETTERLTNEAVESKNVKVIPANTVLLSFKLTVGRVSIATEEMTTNEAIAHFGTDKIFIREYLYLYLKNFHYDSLGSTSAISTAINSKIVKAMPIIIPTETVLEKFSNILKPYFDKILNCQKSIQDLQSARDKLLPKLMNGELITN
ncbi:MAG: restriction endonuclease subunit S [Treponema sp.]|nr:restriction endonuclease subunit S [Treponema sp.]MBR5032040.1 restriction endonuclease subunit S [Treponema sp.]